MLNKNWPSSFSFTFWWTTKPIPNPHRPISVAEKNIQGTKNAQSRSTWQQNEFEQKSIGNTHPWKPTWCWKIPMFYRKYIFKWWIFHCHVSFQGGTLLLRLLFVRFLSKVDEIEFRVLVDDFDGHASWQTSWNRDEPISFRLSECFMQHQCCKICPSRVYFTRALLISIYQPFFVTLKSCPTQHDLQFRPFDLCQQTNHSPILLMIRFGQLSTHQVQSLMHIFMIPGTPFLHPGNLK